MIRPSTIVLMAAALAATAGCSTGQATAHDEPAREVRVGLLEYEVVTSHATVVAGDVVLNITNAGAEAHDLQVDATETLAASSVIAPGETATLTMAVPDDQSELVLWCTLPGHRSQGMLRRIAVTPNEGAP